MRACEGLPFIHFHGFRRRDQGSGEFYSCLNMGIATIWAVLQLLIWPAALVSENQDSAQGSCIYSPDTCRYLRHLNWFNRHVFWELNRTLRVYVNILLYTCHLKNRLLLNTTELCPFPRIRWLSNKKSEGMQSLVDVSTENDIIAITQIVCCREIMDDQRTESQQEALLIYLLQRSCSPGCN